MKLLKKFAFLFFITNLSYGCSDYNLSRVEAENNVDLYPEIEVSPSHLDFGILNADGEIKSLDILIKNIGNDILILDNAYLSNQGSIYSITNLTVNQLEPYEETIIAVTYDPITYEANSDHVSIFSNDDDENESIVTISGIGSAPVIKIDPEQHSFGSIDIGCNDHLTILISNLGDVDLEINDIKFFASLPVDFLLEDQASITASLPLIITPNSYKEIEVSYEPLDLFDDNSYAEISSNDPLNAISYTTQEGYGQYYDIITDSYEQEGMLESDILFVIDNSGSMYRNQTSLVNNFDSFINIFSASGVDYQIAFITTDHGEDFVDGVIITPASTDPVAEVNSVISSIGTHGSAMERGLYESYMSTSTGGDADPLGTFMRPDAKFVIIYVSDEPDHSSSYSSFGTSDYSAHLLSLKSSPSLVVAHAVAGDHPSGCNSGGTYASFGDGYYDVVTDLSGTFVSMCASDWGAQMEELARNSMNGNFFPLSDNPIEDSIYVEINGIASSSWTYDSSANAVSFTADVPEDGDIIDVEYAIYGCE